MVLKVTVTLGGVSPRNSQSNIAAFLPACTTGSFVVSATDFT